MVSKTDLHRADSDFESDKKSGTSKDEDAQAPNKHLAQDATSETASTQQPDQPAVDGILNRLIDHMENSDRRNADAMDALNNRLDQLSEQVQTDYQSQKASSSDGIDDLRDQVFGLSQQDADAEPSNPVPMAKEDDDQTAEIASKINAEETSVISQEAKTDTPSTSKLDSEPMDEIGEADIIYTVTDNIPDAKTENTDITPEDSAQSEPDTELKHDGGTSIEAEGISNDENNDETETLQSEKDAQQDEETVSEFYSSEEDAMEALAIGFQEHELELKNSPSQSLESLRKERSSRLTLRDKSRGRPPAYRPSIMERKGAMPHNGGEIGAKLDDLAIKLETAFESHDTDNLLQTIETQIAELPSYFDREEKRHARIESIETNIAKLTGMIEGTNAAIAGLSEKIAEETATHVVSKLDWGTSSDRLAAIDQYLSSLQEEQQEQEDQSAQALESVHEALEQMIGRLEAIAPATEQPQEEDYAEEDISDESSEESLDDLEDASFIEEETEELEAAQEEEEPAPRKNTHRKSQTKKSKTAASPRKTREPDADDTGYSKETSRQSIDHHSHPRETCSQPNTPSRPDHYLHEQEDDDDYEETDNYVAAARRAAIAASTEEDDWDRHVPPYIASEHSRVRQPGAMNWAKRHKTAFTATMMILVSASAGLLLSQLPLLRGPNAPTQLAANHTPDTVQGNQRNQIPQTTGSIKQPERLQSPQLRPTRTPNEATLYNNSSPQGARPYNQQYTAPRAQLPRTRTPNQNTGQIAPPPGVAIGHVSEKSLRRQLHQSVRRQQITELTKQNTNGRAGVMALLPQTQRQTQPLPQEPPRQALQAPLAQQAPTPAEPLPTASTTHKPLPPASLGPLSLRLAASEGDPNAEYEIGTRYAKGQGTNRNLPEAVRWFKKAATKGYAPAQYRLATHFERGAGIPKDLDRAKVWYRRSASTGNVKAMHNFAVLHTGRTGLAADYPLAAQWFTQAANHGLADSQYNLAILYQNGLGVEKNLQEAYKWLTLASINGDKDAGKHRELLRGQLTTSVIASAERTALNWKATPSNKTANVRDSADKNWAKASAPNTSPLTTSSARPVPRPNLAPQPSITGTLPATTPSQAETAANAPADPLVRKAQNLLSKLGFDTGPADGKVGPKTRNAIIAFERRAGMPITGDVSLDLLKRLASLSI